MAKIPEKDYQSNTQVMGGVQTWALKEYDSPSDKDIRRINYNVAHEFNQKGYGIFHTVNAFYGPRKKENLCRVNAWFFEIDTESKPSTLNKIINSGLTPSMIIESKRGYHVYFACIDPDFTRVVKSWDRIVKHGLVPFYNADKKASDICRILRSPNFYHLKDPSSPYLVQKIWEKKIGYTCSQMERAYPDENKKTLQLKEYKKLISLNKQDGSFWDNIYNLDQELALDRLSGSDYVNGEVYSFKQHSDGTKQILVNNKASSCWIDHEGKIGSYESGGPTVAQWLNWFHKDYSKVATILKEVFPECQKQLSLL